MKNFILLLFVSVAGFSQVSENYRVSENSITWQHVFKSDLSQEEIRSQIQADPILHPMAQNFTGQSNPLKLKCQGNTAIYFNSNLVYFSRIQFKEARYLVEVSRIQLLPSQGISLYGVESTNSPEALESYVLKNNGVELRNGQLHQNALECLDKFLLEKFSFQQPAANNEW